MSIIKAMYIWVNLRNSETKVERQFVVKSTQTELPRGYEWLDNRDAEKFNKAAKGYAREKTK